MASGGYLLILYALFLPQDSARHSYAESLERLSQRFQAMQNYQCLFVTFANEGDESEAMTCNYFFRKPNLVRMEMLSGDHEGTRLLYAGGDVRVRLGFSLLSWITFAFDKNNDVVRDPRHNGIHESHWGYYIDQHLESIPLTEGIYVGSEMLWGKEVQVYELVSRNPEQTRAIAREKIWIDEREALLLQFMQYNKDGKLIQSASYRDVRIDAPLDSTMFYEFDYD